MRFRFQFDDRTSYIKVNSRGTLYILLTIAVGFAATNTMNNLLYLVLSMLLALMGLSGIYARRNLRNIRFEIHPPLEIYKGKKAYFTVKIYSKSGYNIFVKLKDEVSGTPKIEGMADFHIPLIFEKRGIARIEELKVYSSFPFGFFTREEIFPLNLEVLVFPRIYDVKSRVFEILEMKSSGSFESKKPGTGGDFLRLREYQEGEPISQIHWKASRHDDELYTKVFSGPGTGEIVLTERDLKESDPESRIDELASLAEHFLKSGFAVGIEYGDLKIRPDYGEAQRIKILRSLALL